jgi:hypothetical protein
MTLLEAVKSGRKFSSTEVYNPIQYFQKETGPYGHYFTCGYFVVDGEYCTTLDLYDDEILGNYRFIE